MNENGRILHRFPLTSYFALCFIIAWSVWIPAGIWASHTTALVIPGAWAPTIAALLLTWRTGGRSTMRKLLSGLLRWRVKPRYYTFAIFSVLGVATLAVGIHILFGGSPPDVAAIAVQFGLPAEHTYLFIVISPFVFITTILVGGPIAEELGWRGYAQPRMQAQLGAGRAGLAIRFIWSLWHLPLFYYFPSAVAGLPLEYYVPLVTALGVPFAWLYNRTAGSVLLCILLPAGVNFALGVAGGTKLSGNRRLLTAFVGLMIILAFVMYLQIRSIKEVGSSSERGAAGDAT